MATANDSLSNSPVPNGERPLISPEILSQLISAIQSIRYGSIEVIVHNGKVVQLERKEKVRFDR